MVSLTLAIPMAADNVQMSHLVLSPDEASQNPSCFHNLCQQLQRESEIDPLADLHYR